MKVGLAWTGITVAAMTGAAPLLGQGFAVQTHSSCATAMGAAGVASPCEDASAVLFSPGAMALQAGTLSVGWTGLAESGSFTYHRTLEEVSRPSTSSSAPFAFLNHRVSDRIAVGIGAFLPYAFQVTWPEDFEGRFVSHDSKMQNVYVQPTLAYQLAPGIAVGAGVDVVFGSISLNQYLDLATLPSGARLADGGEATFAHAGIQPGTDVAHAKLSADGVGVSFHIGAVARYSDRLSFGARYLHQTTIGYGGSADFTALATNLVIPGGTPPLNPTEPALDLDSFLQVRLFGPGAPFSDQAVRTELTLPSQLVVGLAIRPMAELELLTDYQYTGWESFDQTDIDLANHAEDTPLVFDYQNTSTYRLGAQYALTDALTLRSGFIYNTAAQKEFSVSPLFPEGERNDYAVGLGYRFGSGLAVDVAYQLIDQSARSGRVRGRAPGLEEAELQALNVGVYTADAHVVNVTASYRFGRPR